MYTHLDGSVYIFGRQPCIYSKYFLQRKLPKTQHKPESGSLTVSKLRGQDKFTDIYCTSTEGLNQVTDYFLQSTVLDYSASYKIVIDG